MYKTFSVVVAFLLLMLVVHGAGLSTALADYNEPVILVPGSGLGERTGGIRHSVSTGMNESFSLSSQHGSVLLFDSMTRMLGQMSESLILHYVTDLTGFGPRVTGTPSCRNAGIYLYHEFQMMGLQVRYHNWTYDGYSASNIEATLPGHEVSSNEIYIICAHYDTVEGSPGADDDGSGVAAVLAAARIMEGYQFNHTVRFVAFSGEEQGLLGSYEYVNESYAHGDNIVAVLNADMISYAGTAYDAGRVKVYNDDASAWITQYTVNISQIYIASIGLTVIPSGYTWGSDHNSFWSFGYNAVFYQENFFNPYYHSSQDTIAHMNMAYAKKCSRLILGTLATMAHVIPTILKYEQSSVGQLR